MSNNSGPEIDVESIPEALLEREQWICWRSEDRGGKTTKVPVDPTTGSFASSTDDRTWTNFERAFEYVSMGGADGIGFVFTSTDPLVGVDLDDCRNPETGEPQEPASEIIHRLDSFTEVSPSGTGYHVILEGELLDGRNRHGSIEMYDQARFFTVTADHVEGTPTSVIERQEALEAVHEEFVASEAGDAADSVDADSPDTKTRDQSLELEDEELLEKARSASNGEKFDGLWRGSTAGYDSQSEADMALCCLLAFWTGGDAARVDRLFRQSGLIREKWDEVHYADGSTYGEKTVERALSNTTDVYDPGHGQSDEEADEETVDSTVPEPDEGQVAYLTEKNRLLSKRIENLERTLEEKTDHIEELERRLEQFEMDLSNQDRRSGSDIDKNADSATKTEISSATPSVWYRTKRFFRTDSE